MEAATLPVEEQVEAEAENSTSRLFRYSGYIHVGEGAAECPAREQGTCKDQDHFHAWISLPNSLQHEDINAKARAASARTKRALNDAGDPVAKRAASDQFVTLEADLDELLEEGKSVMIQRICAGRAQGQMQEIITEMTEEEQWENYFQDREEYRRLKSLDVDERGDEYEVLDATMTRFGNELKAKLEAFETSEIEQLESSSNEELRPIFRKDRVDTQANAASIRAYYLWLGYVCTHPVRNRKVRMFPSIEEYKVAAPEAIAAIEKMLEDLENATIGGRGDAAGN